MRAIVALAFVAALGLAAAQNCPIAPATTKLDFSAVPAACAAGDKFCGSCTCALVKSFMPAFTAAGLTIDPANPASYPVDKAAGVITACAVAYSASITAAGVDLQRVAALANCKFDQADTLPSCLVDLLSAPKKDAKTNGTMAMNGTDASPLTVASAEAGAGGPTFTLDGELNTVAELVAAMEASKPLLALLTPAQAKVLAAASKAKLDSMPDLVAYVGTLSNPVDANMLLDRLAAATNMTVAATAGAPTADGCPIQPATTTLDFAGVAPVCTAAAPAAAFCANCTCALLTSFMPAFKKAGLMIDPTMPSMFPVDKAGAAVASCVVAYAPQLTAAGVDVPSIARLADCTFTDATSLPPCVAKLLTPAANATAKANATAATKAAAASGAASVGVTALVAVAALAAALL